MVDRLAGRTALVTGGASGLSQAAAELFAAEGGKVAVCDLNGDGAAETAEKITAEGGHAIAITANVSRAEDVQIAVDRVVTEFGHLDVLLNGAGVLASGSAAETSEDDWNRCLLVNTTGTFLCARAAIPHMSDGGGSIVNIASAAALAGMRTVAAYSASKGAVVSLTRSMAIDFGSQGIRVNAICPGTIRTPMLDDLARIRGDGDVDAGLAWMAARYPIGRLGTPDEIAQVALFLASEESSFVTGAIIAADGGLTAQ
jgi:NAD(P)-dependent dehydrogenase (short-subunit alcohol dehydrogenase family)